MTTGAERVFLDTNVLLAATDPSGANHKESQEFIRQHQLKGKRIHDANLVAVMEYHGLQHLKTWNSKDFSPFGNLMLV